MEVGKKIADLLLDCAIRHKDGMHQVTPEGPWWDKYKIVRDRLGQGFIFALLGPRGTGKTQMATQLCWANANRMRTSRYVVAAEMLQNLRSRNKEGEQKSLGVYIQKKLLIIDEIHERSIEADCIIEFLKNIYQNIASKEDVEAVPLLLKHLRLKLVNKKAKKGLVKR